MFFIIVILVIKSDNNSLKIWDAFNLAEQIVKYRQLRITRFNSERSVLGKFLVEEFTTRDGHLKIERLASVARNDSYSVYLNFVKIAYWECTSKQTKVNPSTFVYTKSFTKENLGPYFEGIDLS
jgi:hypothetical protein